MSDQQPMETKVETYDHPKEYQKGMERMAKQGWTVLNTIDHQNSRSLAGKLFVPGGLITKGKSQIVVTYQRPRQVPGSTPEGMPEGLSQQKQLQWLAKQGWSWGDRIQYIKDHPKQK